MSSVTETIVEIQKNENLSLAELFEKYPYLAKLQHEECIALEKINEKKEKQLICG